MNKKKDELLMKLLEIIKRLIKIINLLLFKKIIKNNIEKIFCYTRKLIKDLENINDESECEKELDDIETNINDLEKYIQKIENNISIQNELHKKMKNHIIVKNEQVKQTENKNFSQSNSDTKINGSKKRAYINVDNY